MRWSNKHYEASNPHNFCVSLAILIGLFTPFFTAITMANDAIPIQWIDLLPESEKAAYLKDQRKLIDIPPLPNLGALSPEADNSWLDRKPIGSHFAVAKHNNRQVEIVGYPIPYSSKEPSSGTLTFLLVPELGAGLYVAAPPPNQVVRVNLPKSLAEKNGTQPTPERPVRITGVLRQTTTDNLPYAYVIEASAWSW